VLFKGDVSLRNGLVDRAFVGDNRLFGLCVPGVGLGRPERHQRTVASSVTSFTGQLR
jgi:hypothetical protein